MNYKFLFALICMTLAFQSHAGIGIKAGANFSKQGFIAGDTKFQPGGSVGVFFEKKAAKVFAFELGGFYHWKRSAATDLDINGDLMSTFKNSFHYLEIPMSFKFYIIKKFNIGIGPYVSYLIAAKAEGVENDGSTNVWNLISDAEFRQANGDKFLNRLDFGAQLSAEFITKGGFGIGARYSQGFGDVTNNDFEWSASMLKPDSEKVLNSSILAYITYKF